MAAAAQAQCTTEAEKASMRDREIPAAFRSIIDNAKSSLSRPGNLTTNLYLDTRVFERGELVGPTFQDIRARQRSLVVFVDEHPKANFGHWCRYRFYDAKSHRFRYEVP